MTLDLEATTVVYCSFAKARPGEKEKEQRVILHLYLILLGLLLSQPVAPHIFNNAALQPSAPMGQARALEGIFPLLLTWASGCLLVYITLRNIWGLKFLIPQFVMEIKHTLVG